MTKNLADKEFLLTTWSQPQTPPPISSHIKSYYLNSLTVIMNLGEAKVFSQ